MSGPMRMAIGPAVDRLRKRLEEARPIVEAQQRTEEGLNRLRQLLVHIRKALETIEEWHSKWRVLMESLEGNAFEAEEQRYLNFHHQEKHFASWVDDGKDMVNEILIILAENDDGSSAISDRQIENNERDQRENSSLATRSVDGSIHSDRNRPVRRGFRRASVEEDRPPVYYPKMPWSYFDGDPLMWPVFWEMFQTNAGNRSISEVQKCSYLVMSLKGKAARAVKGYLPTADNYPLIMDVLKRQFGDDKVIKESLQNELLNLPVANEAVGSLRSCLEDLERICRQLENAGVPEGGDDNFVLMTIKNKFPRAVVLEVLKMEKDSGRRWGLLDWRIGLDEVISLREEALRCTRSLNQRPNESVSRNMGENRFKGNQMNKYNGKSREREPYRSFVVQKANNGENMQRSAGALPNPKCLFCGKPHWAANCRSVTGREARLKIINEQGRCHRCLRRGHEKSQCKGKNCFNCGGNHHKAICEKSQGYVPRTGANKIELGRGWQGNFAGGSKTCGMVAVTALNKKEDVLLMSVRVKVCAGKGNRRCAWALVFFDCGSQVSFITEDFIKKISPPKVGDGDLDILPLMQKSPVRIHSPKYLVNLKLCNGENEELLVSRIDYMTGKIRRVNMKSGGTEVVEENPDILIGMAEFWKFFKGVSPLSNNLFRVETTVGPVICGHMGANSNIKSLGAFTLMANESKGSEEIDKLWGLEGIGIWDNPVEKDDEVALKMFEDTIHRIDGRYVVKWPWKRPREELPTNFGLSYRRLLSLLGKLKTTPELLEAYDGIFKEKIKEGIVEESDIKGFGEHFLPHHCVVVAGKKPRVVYDGSAKTRNGKCLNEMLFRGPVYMPELPGLLIRSRVPKIVLWADIQRAFWTLELEPEDRDVVKFLWLRDVNIPISPSNLLVLRFKRVPFGVISSPFLLGATVRHHLRQENTDLAMEVEKNLFVDNIFVGCRDEKEAIGKYNGLKNLFASARMNLREFISNMDSVNERIPPDDRLEKERPKILGVKWDVKTDYLSIDFPEIVGGKVTRRTVLKGLNSVFDPCGWVGPCVLPGKLFFQKLWEAERRWDDQLSEEEQIEWKDITELWKGVTIGFKRRMVPDAYEGAQIHIFVDASKEAYATCVYLRVEGEHVDINLLYARNRLKPRKMSITIPKMELLGVLIGIRAIRFVEKELGIRVNKKFLWCDSKPVLCWVKSEEEQPRFVENRLKEIRGCYGLECRYIPTEDNPADVGSRGCTPMELKTHPLWWSGPGWLGKSIEYWPKDIVFAIEQPTVHGEEEEEEEAKLVSLALIDENRSFIKFEEFSKWVKLVKLMVRVIKLAKKWREKVKRDLVSSELKHISDSYHVDPRDYGIAERFLLKEGQMGWEDYAKKCPQIRFMRDEDGIIRLKSRVDRSEMPFEFNNPVVFPKKAPILRLLVQRAHEKVLHQRVDATVNKFLLEFWAPGIRNFVKTILRGCAVCRRNHGPAYSLPPMPPHPQERVKRSKPFEYVAIDYFGPSIAKGDEGEGQGKALKYWIALLTCLTTRGIYLEPVFDLTAESFLHVLRRFSSRRGKPKLIISDNAQTFKLAAKVAGSWDARKRDKGQEELDKYLTEGKIGWKFVPALSPWENGMAERMVKVCKDAFKSALGRMILNKEELRTFTAEVESIINSRPLTHVTVEPDGLRALRPIDFISPSVELGIPLPGLKDEEGDEEEFRIGPAKIGDLLRDGWKRTNKVLNWFWDRWNREYLAVLRGRTQWLHKGPRCQESRDPTIGEVVIVEEEMKPRNVWPLGRIVSLAGQKGAIRSVKIKMVNGRIWERPLNRIYPLEVGKVEREVEEKEEDITNECDRGNEQKVGEGSNNHPMITRRKAKTMGGILPKVSVMVLCLMGLICAVFGKLERDYKYAKCGECIVECDTHGITMKTPPYMSRMEICCMGGCVFPKSVTGELRYHLPKQYLLVDHDCVITYWSKRGTRYKNSIICSPVENCQVMGLLSWERFLNRECWNWMFGLAMGSGLLGLLVIMSFILPFFFCLKNVVLGSIWCCRMIWKGVRMIIDWRRGRRRPRRKGEMEMGLLGGRSGENEKRAKSQRKNRRLYKLGLMVVLMSTIRGVNSGAEVAVVQALSEDCTRESNGSVCRIRGAAEVTLLPAGQSVALALKNEKGGTQGSLEIRMLSLRLRCNQEVIKWLRSYRIEVKSARRCPSMGSCQAGRCANVRLAERLPELDGFGDYPGNSFCLEGQSVWGYKCGLPSVMVKECFFYKIMAVPTGNTVWKQVRCVGWDYEIYMKVTLKKGNQTVGGRLTLYPGLTENWEGIMFTPKSVSHPVVPILDDYFLVSDDGVIFAGKDVNTQFACLTPKGASDFDCKLGKGACRECWLNRTEGLVECDCEDRIWENVEPKLPFSSDKISLRTQSGRILSETEYAPIELLVRLEGVKIVSEVDGSMCRAKQNKKLTGCYACNLGGEVDYTCHTDFGSAVAEVRCTDGLVFLAKCEKGGKSQKDVLPFDRAEVGMNCSVLCPGGVTYMWIEGTLSYVPANEREFRARIADEVSSGYEWNGWT